MKGKTKIRKERCFGTFGIVNIIFYLFCKWKHTHQAKHHQKKICSCSTWRQKKSKYMHTIVQ